MTSSPPSSKPGSTSSTPGPTDGKSTQTTTSRSKKAPVMIACARCRNEIKKSDSCLVRSAHSSSRVCQDCVRPILGLAPRKPVSLEEIEREFLEAYEESEAPRSRRTQ